jgi:hypothetical protein
MRGSLPDPNEYRTWQQYAQELTDYLKAERNQSFENPLPQAVTLAHAITRPPAGGPTPGLLRTTTPRATVDGVLVYDPDLGSVMVSIGGLWHPLVDAAWGGMRRIPGTTVAGPDITSTWQTLTQYDEYSPVPFLTSMDHVAGAFALSTTGVYSIDLLATFDHNNSGQARAVDFRFWNAALGISSDVYVAHTASSSTLSPIAISTLLEVNPQGLNSWWVVQIRSDAASADYTSVVWSVQNLTVSRQAPTAGVPSGTVYGPFP